MKNKGEFWQLSKHMSAEQEAGGVRRREINPLLLLKFIPLLSAELESALEPLFRFFPATGGGFNSQIDIFLYIYIYISKGGVD